jgi:SAM-dependent methyltransferase
MSDDHVLVNRASWDVDAPNWVERGRAAWASEEPIWGRGSHESELGLLSDVAGLVAIELGCGTAYISAWMMRRGARVVALDNSSRQLATARVFQREFDLSFPLVHADAEHPPFADQSFDFAISQYGAAIWCDPYVWIPEASRILRPGGRLVFERTTPLVMLCFPADDDAAPADSTLHRDFFGMHRFEWHDEDGAVDAIEFNLGHGDTIRLLRSSGFEVEELFELQAPAQGDEWSEDVPHEWARRWRASRSGRRGRLGSRMSARGETRTPTASRPPDPKVARATHGSGFRVSSCVIWCRSVPVSVVLS